MDSPEAIRKKANLAHLGDIAVAGVVCVGRPDPETARGPGVTARFGGGAAQTGGAKPSSCGSTAPCLEKPKPRSTARSWPGASSSSLGWPTRRWCQTTQPKPGRIVGCLARLKGPVSVEPWQPLAKAAAQALPSMPPPDVWKRLAQAPAQQVAPLLAHEIPQTIALILSQLEPAKAAGLLHHLPERFQAAVAFRIATMETSPAFEVLRTELEVGGPTVVADILNLSGASVEKKVLDQMDAQGPQVAEAVRNMMFVFADIVKLTDRKIETLLREVDQKDLVIALKAADEDLKAKILKNMSEQVHIFITD